MGKKALCLIFAFLLSINSFAAIISDNDGAAFVTKAEFEALKRDFADQIDNYNTSIDSKIDGAIASYLAGIKLQKKETVATGFDLAGKTNKKVQFRGRDSITDYLSKELYGSDKIYLFANGGYTAGPDFYEQDSYDNWIWDGVYTRGNATNAFFLIDSNRCIKNIYWNVKAYVTRTYAFYSTTNARDGITWQDIKISLNFPTNLISTSSADINTNASNTYAKGYGHGRGSTTSTYNNTVNAKVFWNTSSEYVAAGVQCLRTALETKTRTDLKQQLSVLMSKTENNYGYHFCFMPTTKIHTSDKEWGTLNMVTKDKTSFQSYTATRRLGFESGYWANFGRTLTGTRTIQGYGVKFNEILDGTNPKWSMADVYYKEMYDAWGGNVGNYKYTGGFPVYKAEQEGTLEFPIRTGQNTTISFTKQQHNSMPSSTSPDLVPFDYKTGTSAWSENAKTLSMTASTIYNIKIELEKNDIVYLNLDFASGYANLDQPSDAIFTS